MSRCLTAWSVEFFLPHLVFVSAPLLIGIFWQQATFVIGLVLFVLAAVPLYLGRLTGGDACRCRTSCEDDGLSRHS